MHTLEHPARQVAPSLRHDYRRHEPVGRYPLALRGHGTGVRCLPRVAFQRCGYSMPRFPSPGSLRVKFPGFFGTIKALRLPAGRPAALRFLRLAVPREHACFAPAAAACERHRAWGWSTRYPFRDFFRGDDRISQVPGEPQSPSAHVLRPRPAETSQTIAERSRVPRCLNDEGANDKIPFEAR